MPEFKIQELKIKAQLENGPCQTMSKQYSFLNTVEEVAGEKQQFSCVHF